MIYLFMFVAGLFALSALTLVALKLANVTRWLWLQILPGAIVLLILAFVAVAMAAEASASV